jgi:riboflavin synthase
MFTGIILQDAILDSMERHAGGARLRIRAAFDEPLVRGESLAVNGVCLTVLPEDNGLLLTDVSHETLSRTTLASLAPGTRVNVERALAVGDRLGGHIVQGHVDTVGTLLSAAREGDFAVYRWSFPDEYRELVVSKGSIAVDGVSLTIVDPEAHPGNASFGAALIPETLRRTSLGSLGVGERVNLEFDMMAKYVRNLVAPYLAGMRSG